MGSCWAVEDLHVAPTQTEVWAEANPAEAIMSSEKRIFRMVAPYGRSVVVRIRRPVDVVTVLRFATVAMK